MKILVTGAAGFLGQRLIRSLLAGSDLPGPPIVIAADVVPCPIEDGRVDVRTGTITDPSFIAAIVDEDVDVVFHLAAVLSGQSEAEFDVGLSVNVAATQNLLEACRRLTRPPRFVFSSTIAVFGGPLPPVVPESMALLPESSYGTGKAIAELLVNEYARRGFIDGVVCRVPTVAVRPGAPNSALSSFVSGIIREPLGGIASLCPVPLDTRLWISSPEVVTANLAHAGRLPASALEGRRNINLPGITVTPADMLDSLERLGGASARALVDCTLDPHVTRIVSSWPGAFDVTRSLRLGFTADAHVDDVVGQYIAERRSGGARDAMPPAS
jgi:D-erythronate 2-dehydrogenase